MKEYPLVSSIVITYRHFKYLYESLDSIFMQDYPNIELTIMDDGSENFPKQEIETYIQKNKRDNIKTVRVETQVKNVGIVKNINSDLRMAQGEYFVGLNCGDCFFDSTVISRVVQRFLDTGWNLISCRRLLCDEKELNPIAYFPSRDECRKFEKYKTADEQFKAYAMGECEQMASGSSTYVRKSFFDNFGFYDEIYKLLDDRPAYLKYVRNNNKMNLAYDIVSIRYRQGGISTTNEMTPVKEQFAKELALAIEREIVPYMDRFSWQEKRRINASYLLIKNYSDNYIKRVITIRRYPDEIVRRGCNKIINILKNAIRKL